eukprot:scaffold15799_cov41-Attheya_sp.AAC.1
MANWNSVGSNSGIGVARMDSIVRRKFISAFFEMLDGVVGSRTDTNNQNAKERENGHEILM